MSEVPIGVIKQDKQGCFYFDGSCDRFFSREECIVAYKKHVMMTWIDPWYIQSCRG